MESPWRSSGLDSMLSLPRASVQSLVRELSTRWWYSDALSYLPGQGTKIHKQGSVHQKSNQILTDILPSDFKVISPDVLVLSHLGCPSQVSYRETTQVEPGSINSCSGSDGRWCSAATMRGNFWKSGTKFSLKSSNTGLIPIMRIKAFRGFPY